MNQRYHLDIKVACPACKAIAGKGCVNTNFREVHFGRRLMAMATEKAARDGVPVEEVLALLEAGLPRETSPKRRRTEGRRLH